MVHFTLFVTDITKNQIELKALCTMERGNKRVGVSRYLLTGDIQTDGPGSEIACPVCNRLFKDLTTSLGLHATALMAESDLDIRDKAFARRRYGWNLESFLKDAANAPRRLRELAAEMERATDRMFPEGST